MKLNSTWGKQIRHIGKIMPTLISAVMLIMSYTLDRILKNG